MTSSDPQRTVLPMPERQHVGRTRYCRTPTFERLADQGLKFTAGGDDHDHLITPEERIRVATAVQ